MKTIKSFACLTAAALSFVACQKNEISNIETAESTFTFTSARPQLEADTKTEYTGTTIQWSKGDAIRMAFTVDGVWQTTDGNATLTDGKSNAKMYASTTLSTAGEIAEFSIPNKFTAATNGEYVFYTIYPSSASYENFTYAPSATIKITDNQTPTSTSFDSDADVMFGKSVEEYTSKPTSAIPLDWTRLVAHGDITLKGLKNTIEGETITSIVLTAQEGADLVGTHYFDVTTETLTLPNNNTTANILKINGDNLTIDNNGNVEFWISILPETITSLKVEVETNKANYTREISGVNLAFAQNKRNTLAIKMDGVDRVEKDPVSQVIANGNYVIACDEDMMVASSSNVQGVAALSTNTDVDGNLIVDGEALWTITYDKENEVYYIMSVSSNKFLNGASSKTDLKLAAESDKTGFTAVKNSDGLFKLTTPAVSGTTRGIGYNYNSGNSRFGMYSVTATDQVTDLTLIPAVKDITPSLSFTTTNKSVLASATSVQFNFEAKNLGAGEPAVTVGEDKDGIISSETLPSVTDGTITVTLIPNTENKEKTATLTVSATGLENIVLTITQAAYTGGSDTVTDILTYSLIGITGTSYSAWNEKTSESTAVYAGNSAGGNNSIQLRSKNSSSGIVTTTSGGTVAKIKITWNSNTESERTVSIYGSNTAYSSAEDLYNSSEQGTLLGEIAKGSSELEVEGDYTFIGIRSKSGALYIDKIEITWK